MPIAICGHKRRKLPALRPAIKQLLTLLFFAFCTTALHAQTIQIKLIDGKTGRPITDVSLLNVWVGTVREFPFMIAGDKNGIDPLRLAQNDNELNVPLCVGMNTDAEKLGVNPSKQDKQAFNKKYRKDCTDIEVDDPVVKYADTIAIQVSPGDASWKAGGQDRTMAYVPCWVDTNINKEYWKTIIDFQTKDVLQQGAVTANTCGTATASANPGQIILFVRLPGNKEYLREFMNRKGRMSVLK